MTLAAKRRFWMRFAVILGVALFVTLALMAAFSVVSSGSDVHANLGVRFPGFWSGLGLLLTLAIAAPFVAIVAWKKWKSPDE
jgi:hypothetical protein